MLFLALWLHHIQPSGRKETLPGGTDPTLRVPPRSGKVLPWWPGVTPGVPLGCTQRDRGVLPGEWMIVGIGVTCGGEFLKN